MTTVLVAGFLVAHGLIHLAIWLPHPPSDPDKPPPFVPDHSAVLTRVAPRRATHRLSVGLAVAAGAGFALAGVAVATSAGWAAGAAVAAALAGLTLKLVFFHPWLLVGILLDLAVLGSATVGWPVSL